MTEHPDDDAGNVFVYGTLMPGRLRWPLIEPFVTSTGPAIVAGALYDTGRGYPAACFDEPGEIPGWLLGVDPDHRARAIDLLDRVEGPEYHRVRVVTLDGRPAVSYAWIGPRESLVRLAAWEPARDHER